MAEKRWTIFKGPTVEGIEGPLTGRATFVEVIPADAPNVLSKVEALRAAMALSYVFTQRRADDLEIAPDAQALRDRLYAFVKGADPASSETPRGEG